MPSAEPCAQPRCLLVHRRDLVDRRLSENIHQVAATWPPARFTEVNAPRAMHVAHQSRGESPTPAPVDGDPPPRRLKPSTHLRQSLEQINPAPGHQTTWAVEHQPKVPVRGHGDAQQAALPLCPPEKDHVPLRHSAIIPQRKALRHALTPVLVPVLKRAEDGATRDGGWRPAWWWSRSSRGGVGERGGAVGWFGGLDLLHAAFGQVAVADGDPFAVQREWRSAHELQERASSAPGTTIGAFCDSASCVALAGKPRET